MRRGRPPTISQTQPQPAKPDPSPMRVANGDPFAALDVKQIKDGKADGLASRFPTLDQFSLLHDQGAVFSFDEPAAQTEPPKKNISQKVVERLADDAFATLPSKPPPLVGSLRPAHEITSALPYTPAPPEKETASQPLVSASAPSKSAEMSRASAIISSMPELQAISSQTSQAYPTPSGRPKMVSTGTMTSTPPPERTQPQPQVYRFPPSDQHRSSSLPERQEAGASNQLRPDSSSRPGAIPRVPSFQSQPTHARHPSSSRPSLEGARPSPDLLDQPITKSASLSGRPRPVSTHLESNLDYLREKESAPRALISPGHPSPKYAEAAIEPKEEAAIESNVDFLRSMEDLDPKKDKGHPKQGKRSSLGSLSGTKNILVGKFGDAFKRFEGNAGGPPPPRTPSPLKWLERQDLTPIAGSEATDERSDDGQVLEETDDMSPEMRREIERRRLSMEEKRVAAAGAEYRQRIAQRETTGPGFPQGAGSAQLPKSIGGVPRAVSIQHRVQSLLSDSQTPSNAPRTAEGYGHYADNAATANWGPEGRPEIPRKPVGGAKMPATADTSVRRPTTSSEPVPTASASRPTPSATGGPPKPMAKPKPIHLNKTPTAGGAPLGGRPSSPVKPSSLGKSLPKAPAQLMVVNQSGQPVLDMSPEEKEDYVRDFSKRYPSLSSIEMVERDLAAEARDKGR